MTELPLVCAGATMRPKQTSDMRLQAATELVEHMIKSGVIPDDDREICAQDIAKATRYESYDGYKIARELENLHHWECDMQIAEELEGFSRLLDRIYSAAERQWDTENPRGPKFTDGTTVIWRGKPATVHGVYEHRPQCYRVRQGEMGNETSFYIVPFEDVTSPETSP